MNDFIFVDGGDDDGGESSGSAYIYTGRPVFINSAIFYGGTYSIVDIYTCFLISKDVAPGHHDLCLSSYSDSRPSI